MKNKIARVKENDLFLVKTSYDSFSLSTVTAITSGQLLDILRGTAGNEKILRLSFSIYKTGMYTRNVKFLVHQLRDKWDVSNGKRIVKYGLTSQQVIDEYFHTPITLAAERYNE